MGVQQKAQEFVQRQSHRSILGASRCAILDCPIGLVKIVFEYPSRVRRAGAIICICGVTVDRL
jgi:hypothetical protein